MGCCSTAGGYKSSLTAAQSFPFYNFVPRPRILESVAAITRNPLDRVYKREAIKKIGLSDHMALQKLL